MAAAPPVTMEAAAPQPTVIPGADSLTGDLLDLDIGGPSMGGFQPPAISAQQPAPAASGVDLLGDGLDNLVSLEGSSKA